jgi:hypothetical protein
MHVAEMKAEIDAGRAQFPDRPTQDAHSVIAWIGPVITSGVGQARLSLKTKNRQPISPLRSASRPSAPV